LNYTRMAGILRGYMACWQTHDKQLRFAN